MKQRTSRRAVVIGFAAMLSVGAFWGGTSQADAAVTPVAVDDDYSVAMNDVLTVAAPGLLGNDTDRPVGSSYKRIQDAGHNAANSFSFDGAFSYTPDTDFAGDDSYTYCITASPFTGECLSNVATINIHVLAPPVAVDDEYSTEAGTALSEPAPGFLGNDTNLPSSPTFNTLTSFLHSADFDLNGDGSVAYTPAAGFTGDDTATYCITASANDQTCVSNTATVTVHVLAAPPDSSGPSTSAPPSSGSITAGTNPTAIETTDEQLPVDPSPSSTGLAATGFPAGAVTLTGILIVLTGSLLLAASRRRRGRHA
jgi:hypothetical protein